MDVSGIPNMGFGGGNYFGTLGGNAATGQPAMSSAQINASMGWNPYASFNPWANSPGGFGGLTNYYSNLGAAYGRNTGGFGGGGGGDGGQAARIAAIYGRNALAQTMAPRQYGWDANEGAQAPNPYRAPMSYGWGHNEGAPAPAYTPPHPMGQFNPHSYGWDHNEGARFAPTVPSPYGPGGAPTGISPPAQQSMNQNWYGMPNASS